MNISYLQFYIFFTCYKNSAYFKEFLWTVKGVMYIENLVQ